MQQFFFVTTADGAQLQSADGAFIVIEDERAAVLLNFLKAMREVALEEGFVSSTHPDRYDEVRGKRLHRQFFISGRLVSTASISQASDNVWEFTFHIAWQPNLGRSDPDFGFFELSDALASLNNAWQSKLCPLWDEPIRVSSATPEWDDELKAWDVAVNVETLERRSWAPTS